MQVSIPANSTAAAEVARAQNLKKAAVESTHQRNTYVKRHYSSHF